MGIKLIIAGSRSIVDYKVLLKAIEFAGIIPEDIDEVVSGGANGIDKLGEKWAESNKIKITKFIPSWKDIKTEPVFIKKNAYGQYNALAGHIRNAKMAEYGDMLLAIWTDGSTGTANMIEEMEKLDKEVIVYEI